MDWSAGPAVEAQRLHDGERGGGENLDAAGLRLAAISLAGHADPERFVAEFSGNSRTVAEYLIAEMLECQAAEVQQLLLRTSLLDRVNGELADLLTGRPGSERILLDLEDANAFVVSLDPERTWFRYHHPGARCLLLNSGDISEDLTGLDLAQVGEPPVDVVLVGGAGPEFSYQALNQAFSHLQRGARLVAMHRGLYWRTSEGLQLDTGAFLAGLEQAAATKADVVGKPAAAFFAAALAHLGADAAHTVMTGDDIETDVLAAQRHGLTGVLVKTGKYLPRTHHSASGTPDHILGSFASLPGLLEQLS